MATHTAEELKMAARVLGEAARGIGLDPAAMGQSMVEERADAPFDVERERSVARAA
jgi:hypothetical protein